MMPKFENASDIVVSNVDLVAVRSQSQWPEDPQEHMRDYFGNYRSPEWDVMEQLGDEN